jgi:hypothetical protein
MDYYTQLYLKNNKRRFNTLNRAASAISYNQENNLTENNDPYRD